MMCAMLKKSAVKNDGQQAAEIGRCDKPVGGAEKMAGWVALWKRVVSSPPAAWSGMWLLLLINILNLWVLAQCFQERLPYTRLEGSGFCRPACWPLRLLIWVTFLNSIQFEYTSIQQHGISIGDVPPAKSYCSAIWPACWQLGLISPGHSHDGLLFLAINVWPS